MSRSKDAAHFRYDLPVQDCLGLSSLFVCLSTLLAPNQHHLTLHTYIPRLSFFPPHFPWIGAVLETYVIQSLLCKHDVEPRKLPFYFPYLEKGVEDFITVST
jgi:hypothetical protein